MKSQRPNTPSLETLLAQADHFIDPVHGAIVPPLQPSTTFARDENYDLLGEYSYARSDNPTVRHVEQVLAKLEGAREARLFASGMAAFSSLTETFDQGTRIVAPQVMYHGARDWLLRVAEKRNITVDLFDQSQDGALAQTVESAPTDLVWIESPVNPTWDVIDIAAAARVAHASGALLGVDSTVAPPVTTRPLDLGADYVFHSATKYLNGHSDVNGGVLASNDTSERWAEIDLVRGLLGAIMPPFEAWLLMRGLRTLAVRFDRACENAMAIARHLENHARIECVLYPGLASHPGHKIATAQMTNGYGGMMSLLVNGNADDARKIAGRTKLWVPATSLGGVESLIEHRATIEGAHSVVPDNLLRLSVGIENAGELIDDLVQALN